MTLKAWEKAAEEQGKSFPLVEDTHIFLLVDEEVMFNAECGNRYRNQSVLSLFGEHRNVILFYFFFP